MTWIVVDDPLQPLIIEPFTRRRVEQPAECAPRPGDARRPLGVIQHNMLLYLRFERQVWRAGVDQVEHRAFQIETCFRQPDRVNVRFQQVFVGQVDLRRCHSAGNHVLRALKEILVVPAGSRTVGDNQCRLTTAPCSPRSLRVVGGGRRHIAHMHRVQIGDVDPQFLRR